jgi:hypothetical protein
LEIHGDGSKPIPIQSYLGDFGRFTSKNHINSILATVFWCEQQGSRGPLSGPTSKARKQWWSTFSPKEQRPCFAVEGLRELRAVGGEAVVNNSSDLEFIA